jgi:serine/threonine protein phosphatase 1
MLTFAVGDIHGQKDKLLRLLAYCEGYNAEANARFVFIGDYIDRGPDSSGVIDILIRLQQSRKEVICLRGNHEAALLEVLDGAPSYRFLLMGGDATLVSYGVQKAREIPAAHLEWMKGLPYYYEDDLRLFVHAGVDLGRPLSEQLESDLLWIREPFLSDRRQYDRLVIHGHTPQHSFEPEIKTNRVNIDTAAAYGGPITAAVFRDGSSYPFQFINSDGRQLAFEKATG